MRRDIELYISNKRVDLNDDSFILMNYTAEDADKPTAVLNSFSKQVTLPPTDTNKKLFENMETADRVTAGNEFNPLERTEFMIMIGGALFESGYCRMDYASPEEGYVLTLFGGLGSFMYALSYSGAGDTLNLANLDFLGAGDASELDFIINKDTVQEAWTYLKNGTAGKWQVVNFAPMYNGIPSDAFEADKGLIALGSAGIPVTTEGYDGKTGADYRRYTIVNFTKEFSEWDMRDLRSYLQRPVLSINAFMTAIAREANNGGWTVDWMDVATLPEVMQGWLTLPMLKTEKPEKTQTVPSSTSATTTEDYTEFTITPNSQSLPSGGSAELSVSFQPRFLGVYGDGDYPTNLVFDGATGTGTRPTGALFMQLVAYDSNNLAVGASDIAYVASQNRYSGENLASICDFTPRYPGKAYAYVFAYARKQSNNVYQLDKAVTLKVQAYNARYFRLYIDFVHAKVWPFGGSVGRDARILYDISAAINRVYNYQTVQANMQGTPQVTYTLPSTVRSNAKITKSILLDGTPTPAAVLTGLARTLGWKITSDYTSKTVRIVRRGTYYTGEVIDIDKKIDRSQPYRLAPNFFQSRYLDFQTDMIESDFAAFYSGKYGRAYGSMRVDTNYKFNKEHLNMFDGVVLKQGITAEKLSSYFYTIIEKAVRKPAAFRDTGNTFTLWSNTDNSAKEFDVPTLTDAAEITPINSAFPGYDDGRRLLMENGGKGISEGFGVLLYRQGQESVYAALSDDETLMDTLLDGKACWKPYFGSDQIDVPAFRTYLFSGDDIVTASDFGQPKELDIPAGTFLPDATIFERYWKDFVADRYDVDAKVCTCFVRWEGIQVNNELLQKFFYFDNTLWSLNKISNYPVNSDDPCECEFIRVMDPEAYSQSYVPAKYINVNPTFILFPVGGGAQTIQVSTNAGPYTVNTSEASWITSTPIGGSHDATITLTATPNSTGQARDGRVAIYSASLNKTIYVNVLQESYYLRVRPLTARVPARGETVTFQVESNAQWEVNCPDDDIVIMPDYGSGYGTVEVEIPENKYLQQRVITVNFTSDQVAEGEQAVITQDFFQFNVTPRTLTMPKEGGPFFLNIETTADWVLVLPPAMLMNETTGTGDARVEIYLRANSGDERELVIQARCKPVADQWDEEHPDPQEGEVNPGVIEVTVTQAGTPRLAVTPKSLDFNANGGTATLQVTANETFTWNAPAWLTITDVTPAPGPDDPPTFDKTLQVTAAANTTTNPRVKNIDFTSASGLTDSVLVNQNGATIPTLNVIPSSLNFDEEGESLTIEVYSNEPWSITDKPGWLTADILSGIGPATVTLTAGPNNTQAVLTGDIVVTSQSSLSATVAATQAFITPRYLTFRSMGGNTLEFREAVTGTLEYSRDGQNWQTWDLSALTINDGEEVYIRGLNPNGLGYRNGFNMGGNGTIAVSGNVMHLLDYTQDLTALTSSQGFERLFAYCSPLTDASGLLLPATTLRDSCYKEMFTNCSALVYGPASLPATILAQDCYNGMFSYCSSLISGPTSLPATRLEWMCYANMFDGCTALTTVPSMDADIMAYGSCQNMFRNCSSITTNPLRFYLTTLAPYCCNNMFYGCSSLTEAILPVYGNTVFEWCYYGMYGYCTALTTIRGSLPATTLADSCYSQMFAGCTSLTSAPQLPATTLANNCYDSMFSGCSALAAAPDLPATVMASYCYSYMFFGCRSLTSGPNLPATTLAQGCYSYMFAGCRGLTSAPALPATILTDSCYESMFRNCSALMTAPVLPAENLASNCYKEMFYSCSLLNYIKAMFLTEPGTAYTENWVYGVSYTGGTFVYNSAAVWDPANFQGPNGIPQSWTPVPDQ